MSSTLTLKVGNVTSAVTLKLTDQQVAQVLLWFVEDWATPVDPALTQAQQNQYYLDQAAARIVAYMRSTAQHTRERDLAAAQQSISDQASADTAI